MEGRLSSRLRDAGPLAIISFPLVPTPRIEMDWRWVAEPSCSLPTGLHTHCHLADEQAFDGNPAAKCGPSRALIRAWGRLRGAEGLGATATVLSSGFNTGWLRPAAIDRASPGATTGAARAARRCFSRAVLDSNSRRSRQFDAYRRDPGSFLAARFFVDGNLNQPIRRAAKNDDRCECRYCVPSAL